MTRLRVTHPCARTTLRPPTFLFGKTHQSCLNRPVFRVSYSLPPERPLSLLAWAPLCKIVEEDDNHTAQRTLVAPEETSVRMNPNLGPRRWAIDSPARTRSVTHCTGAKEVESVRTSQRLYLSLERTSRGSCPGPWIVHSLLSSGSLL